MVHHPLPPVPAIPCPRLGQRLGEPERVGARLCWRYSRGTHLAATLALIRGDSRLCGRLCRDQPRRRDHLCHDSHTFSADQR